MENIEDILEHAEDLFWNTQLDKDVMYVFISGYLWAYVENNRITEDEFNTWSAEIEKEYGREVFHPMPYND